MKAKKDQHKNHVYPNRIFTVYCNPTEARVTCLLFQEDKEDPLLSLIFTGAGPRIKKIFHDHRRKDCREWILAQMENIEKQISQEILAAAKRYGVLRKNILFGTGDPDYPETCKGVVLSSAWNLVKRRVPPVATIGCYGESDIEFIGILVHYLNGEIVDYRTFQNETYQDSEEISEEILAYTALFDVNQVYHLDGLLMPEYCSCCGIPQLRWYDVSKETDGRVITGVPFGHKNMKRR